MIDLKCSTQDTVLLSQMVPFQGDLKKRTDKDIDDLLESLKTDGLLMPFALWQSPDDKLFILDGHGRYQALIKGALTDVSLLQQELPCILVTAGTEDEARKALLQIVSTYGKVQKVGVIKFAATVSNYKAPIVTKAMRPIIKAPQVEDDFVVVKLKVRKDMVQSLTDMLKTVKGIELY